MAFLGRGLLAAIAGLTCISAAPPPDGQWVLLSIAPPPLAPNEFMSGFEIETVGVEIGAVCHLPYGWRLTAGKDDSVTGLLSAEAGLGVTYVSPANNNYDRLQNLFLIKVEDYSEAPRRNLPPTFVATATVGRYGPDGQERTVALKPENLSMTPAAGCPAPQL